MKKAEAIKVLSEMIDVLSKREEVEYNPYLHGIAGGLSTALLILTSKGGTVKEDTH